MRSKLARMLLLAAVMVLTAAPAAASRPVDPGDLPVDVPVELNPLLGTWKPETGQHRFLNVSTIVGPNPVPNQVAGWASGPAEPGSCLDIRRNEMLAAVFDGDRTYTGEAAFGFGCQYVDVAVEVIDPDHAVVRGPIDPTYERWVRVGDSQVKVAASVEGVPATVPATVAGIAGERWGLQFPTPFTVTVNSARPPVTVSVPESVVSGDTTLTFAGWQDGVGDRIRPVTVQAGGTVELTATYAPPPSSSVWLPFVSNSAPATPPR